MTNYATGHLAEKYAVEHLKKRGYKIVGTNWKTRYCEIDIIAEHSGRLHFIEVKYRENLSQGSGFDYISDRKLRQMKFAAEMWISQKDWAGESTLAAIELTGPDFRVTNFLPVL